MNQFNLGNFMNRFINNSLLGQKGGASGAPLGAQNNSGVNFQPPPSAMAQNAMPKSLLQSSVLNNYGSLTMANFKMNNLANLERGLYIKDLMKLPKDLQEALLLLQNKIAPGEELTKLLTTNINLASLAEMMQQGGKEAMNKLVMAMAEASKQGINDLSQLKDAMKLINASVSVAGQDNANQLLKSFMLLYLPWLPLQEGVDFELEIESSEGESGESEISITIMISTRNFGNVRVTLILLAGNSMSIFINSSDIFPKEELMKRIDAENKAHAMQSEVVFEQKEMKQDENAPRQAKISMSNLKEVNPFLLLMANAIIRHTIDLDNLAG